MITFCCIPCGKQFEVGDEFKGRAGKCPRCGAVLEEVGEAPQAVPVSHADRAPLPEPDKPIGPAAPPSAPPKGFMVFLKVAAALVVFGVLQYSFSGRPENPGARAAANSNTLQGALAKACDDITWQETEAAIKPYTVLSVRKTINLNVPSALIYISAPTALSDFEKIATCFSGAISGIQTLEVDVCQVVLKEEQSKDDDKDVRVQFAQNSTFYDGNGQLRNVQAKEPVRVFPNDKGIPCLMKRLDPAWAFLHVNNPEMLARIIPE